MPFIGNKPSAVPLTSADIADGIITSAKIVDGTITNSDVASSIITGQTAETSIDGADSVLIYDDSASALRKMTRTNFVSGVGGNNTPYFLATSNTGTIGSATWTKLPFANEVVDTSNCFDTTNYRFTSNVAGYYFVYIKMLFYANPGSDNMKSGLVSIYKNGSAVHNGNNGYYRNGAGLYYFMQPQVSYYVYLNGTTDYIEAWGFMESSGGLNYDGGGCYFMAHKLIA